MFKLIEAELKAQSKTKVWLANKLGESTQNVNNWKARGVPAGKVAKIAHALSVSREFLEGNTSGKGGYVNEPANNSYRDNDNNKKFLVFVDVKESRIRKLLDQFLHTSDGLSFVYSTSWKYTEPFLELNIWQAENEPPRKTFLPIVNIIGIQSL